MKLQFSKNIGAIVVLFQCDTDVQELDAAKALAIRDGFAFDMTLTAIDPKLINGIKVTLSDIFTLLAMDDSTQQTLLRFYKLSGDTTEVMVTDLALSADGQGTINIDQPSVDSGSTIFPLVGCGFSFTSGFRLTADEISKAPDIIM